MIITTEALINAYGTGRNLPTLEQWETLIKGDMNAPLTVVNFFKLREKADPALTGGREMTGMEAFTIYAETSVPKVSEVGGHFILRGGVEGHLIGKDLPQWDIIAIGQYPKRKYFLQLFQDENYKTAFTYRQAAIETQNVFLVNAV